ncbi:MAG: hypothetical protein V4643_15080 [Bacteroidota bacterium]
MALAGVSAANLAADLLALQRLVMNKGVDNGSSDDGEYKKPKSNISGKEGAKDVPSWAKGNKPRIGENGDKFARRLLDEKYGKGNYSTKSNTEYSKIAKWGNRAFE